MYKHVSRVVIALLISRAVVKFINYIKWRNALLKTFPIPKSSVLTGNLNDFIKAGGFTEGFFKELHKKHGPVAGFFLLPNWFNLSVTEPDIINEILNKATVRPVETYSFLRYLGSDNLMFAHGPRVKELRLKYGQMITNRPQLEKINKISQVDFKIFFEGWSKRQDGFDGLVDLKKLDYDTIGKAFFDGGWLENDIGQELFSTHMYMIENADKFVMLPWLFRPYGYLKYNLMTRKLRSLCSKLLNQRRKEIERNPEAFKNDESCLTVLINDDYFNHHLAVTTVIGMLNGSFDTTVSTLYWLCYNLCRHPEEQEKLRNEIVSGLNVAQKVIAIDDIRNLPYLDAFYRESMRHFSSVPVNQRVSLDEDLFISEKLIVPKGVNVNLPTAVIMKDPKLFGEDIEEFRPSRFLNESPVSAVAKRAFYQFGGHARMCIGMTFAIVELKAFLVALLKDYRMEFSEGSEKFTEPMIEAGVTMPKTKLRFRITKL